MFAAIVLTMAAVVTKFAGVLTLSWWIVICPVPVVLVLSFLLFLLGETRLGRRWHLNYD